VVYSFAVREQYTYMSSALQLILVSPCKTNSPDIPVDFVQVQENDGNGPPGCLQHAESSNRAFKAQAHPSTLVLIDVQEAKLKVRAPQTGNPLEHASFLLLPVAKPSHAPLSHVVLIFREKKIYELHPLRSVLHIPLIE
jgi:hypothetical protein